MSLLTDLREVAEKLDPSILPTANEVGGLLGALIYRVEHGDSFVADVADKDKQDVSDLIAEHDQTTADQKAEDERPAADQKAQTDLEAQIADLQAQLATRRGTENRTVADHNEGDKPVATAEFYSPPEGQVS